MLHNTRNLCENVLNWLWLQPDVNKAYLLSRLSCHYFVLMNIRAEAPTHIISFMHRKETNADVFCRRLEQKSKRNKSEYKNGIIMMVISLVAVLDKVSSITLTSIYFF